MKLRYSLILSFVITLSTFANEPKEGLLWRISGNGLAQPSYLFGTWHGDTELRNHSFLDSVPGFHKAFNSTHQYMGEINLLAKQPKIQHISEKIFLPKDTLYSDLLDQKDLSKLDTFLTKKLRTNSSKVNLRPGMLQYMLKFFKLFRRHVSYLFPVPYRYSRFQMPGGLILEIFPADSAPKFAIGPLW